MKRTDFFLIFLCLILFCSCSSLDVRTHKVIDAPLNILQTGRIVFVHSEWIDLLDEEDIGLLIKNHEKYPDVNPHGLKLDFQKTDEIDVMVYDNSYNYEIVVKYIDQGYDPFSIKARVKLNGYSINTLEPQSFFYHGVRFSTEATALQLPIELNFFNVKGKKFALIATVCSIEGTKGRTLYTMKDQKFLIVDRDGNIYASFTYDNYELYQQPDSNKYDFKPVIAAYIIIRAILRNEIK